MLLPRNLLFALTSHLTYRLLHNRIREWVAYPINPDAVFPSQRYIPADWPQSDFLFRTLQLECIAGDEFHLVS
jgi:hypothetical protein